ncbi:MAG: alcohol dehydrogenase catalytic domain-containing protein, partial [Nitrososphaeraceae archaeon]
MNTSVKTAQITSNGKVHIIDNMIQTSSDGDIVVKMRACGICGSDLEKVFGSYGMSSSRLGHEPSGDIIFVGKNVSSNFKIGDRVFVHHHVSCNSCHYCRHGDFTMCSYYQKSNLNPCGLSEKFIVPRWNVERGGVLKIPDNLSFENAALIEPVACCIRALNKINIDKGDDVAVFGAGPVGIMLVCLLKIYGAGHIFLIDIN